MFSGMLGGIGLKMLAVGVLMALVGAAFLQYNIVKGERNAAIAQIGALEVANSVQQATISDQEKAIDNWVAAQAKMQITLDALAAAQTEANTTARELNDVLSKRDLTALSLAKPGLIQRRINSGTANILRMFKSASRRSDIQ